MASFERKLEAFLEHYEQMKSVDNEEAFLKEFMRLKAQSAQYKEQNVYPADSGQQSYNRKKNRFKDIIPFEYTRVSLHAVEGIEGSDYVNANYIQGVGGNVTYIAAQGPLPHTVGDFWRMLWYHNIEILVMACKLVEMAKPKCECYWPALKETKSYGPITVTTIEEENIANDFIIRDFVAECEGEKQHIRQYHYSSWPDHGRPDHPQPVLKMVEMIHGYRQRLDVPILVHCSAGCGRTGTIIAIDIARTMVLTRNIPNTFSPHDIVESMRKQRPAMVQAKEQYVFVFMAMAELSCSALGRNKPKNVAAPARATVEGTVGNGEDDRTYENLTEKGTPVPLPRGNNTSSSSIKTTGGSGEEKTSPVPPRRANQSSENPQSKPAKVSPPLKPKPKLTGTDHTDSPRGGGNTTKPRPAPPPKKPVVEVMEDAEGQYSVVDLSQIRDKGPEIAVVSEEGKVAPLSKVEEELDRHGGEMITSRSILETIMDEVGDLLPPEEEEREPSPPPPPPPHANQRTTFEDEIPPPIPLHTEASTHIMDTSKSDSDRLICDSGIYYAPTPHSIPVPSGPSAVTNHSTPPRPTSPQRAPAATLPTTTPTPKGSRGLKIFKIGKSKSEKRKPLSTNDIGRPTGLSGSPGDPGSSPRHSPSPDHGMSSSVPKNFTVDLGPAPTDPANNRYTFPGEMGFGMRVPRPKGPRPEPPHWNGMRNNITVV